jgi:hypothetical protein
MGKGEAFKMQVSHVLIGIKQKLVEGKNGSWFANVRMS